MFGWKKSAFGDANQMTEQSSANDSDAEGAMTGIVSGVRVATAMGWRPIEAIAVGDRVLTFDGGLQVVTQVQRKFLWTGTGDCPRQFWPLEVPKGALGNREVMSLLPRQPVMLESDAAEQTLGDPFALIPAEAMDGMNGITRVPPRGPVAVVVLQFAEDQIVFANSGALFFCPAARDLVSDVFNEGLGCGYQILPLDKARALAALIDAEFSAGQGVPQHDIPMAAYA